MENNKQKKYLYAASVQGIQSFIFASDVLKEIVGASELIQYICTELPKEILFDTKSDEEVKAYDKNSVVTAAGNIRQVFEDRDLLKKIFSDMPLAVARKAPGLVLSQTIYAFEGELDKNDLDNVEKILQGLRNQVQAPSTLGLMIAQRNPETGLPLVSNNAKQGKDLGAQQKIKAFKFYRSKELRANQDDRKGNPIQRKNSSNYSDRNFLPKNKYIGKPFKGFMTDLNQVKKHAPSNTWLAVIHADGNDFGKLLPIFTDAVKKSGLNFQTCFRAFSQSLDTATRNAAQKAFEGIYGNYLVDKANRPSPKEKKYLKEKLLFRPLILGGDDLTAIVHAPEAMKFTEAYLKAFQEESKNIFNTKNPELGEDISLASICCELKNGLTACAGIAYVKSKFPMYQALNLAEELCKEAKRKAKEQAKEAKKQTEEQAKDTAKQTGITPASIAFYRMESSMIRKYANILKNDLTVQLDKRLNPISISQVYFLNEKNTYNTSFLRKKLNTLNNYKSAPSRLRRLLSLYTAETVKADEITAELKRIEQVMPKAYKSLALSQLDPNNKQLTNNWLYDVVTLHSLEKNSTLKLEAELTN